MLIVFEGVHSSGKSTQCKMLSQWLCESGCHVVDTSWNSSEPLGATITGLKIDERLPSRSMVLMEAADLAYRYETVLESALERGAIVICDRYFYTTITRGMVRGIPRSYLRGLFDWLPDPDLIFHVNTFSPVTLSRRLSRGQSVGSHLCGADFRHVDDESSAFVEMQDKIHVAYKDILPGGVVDLPDGHTPEELHMIVRSVVSSVI